MKYIFSVLVACTLATTSWGSAVRDAQKELGINDKTWKTLTEKEGNVSWLVKPGLVITLMVTAGHDKDLPNQERKTDLYEYYRNEALGYKGGLVEVLTREKSGVGYNLVTMKFPLREMSEEMKDSLGWAYQINAVIPTHNRTYVIQAAAMEQGTTGTREAGVTVIAVARGDAKNVEEYMRNFRRDPYDRKHDGKAQFTASDERQWDAGFPDHPLTIIRVFIDKVIQGCSFSAEVRAGALYKTSASSKALKPTPAGHMPRQP